MPNQIHDTDEPHITEGDRAAYRVKEITLDSPGETAYYADIDDAIQHVKDAADRDGWRLVEDGREYPWATDRSRQVVIIPIHICDEYRGLPNDGGDE